MNQTATFGPAIPPQISIAVAQATDQQTLGELQRQNTILQMQAELASIPSLSDSQKTLDEWNAAVQAAQDRIAQAIQNATADNANSTSAELELLQEARDSLNQTAAAWAKLDEQLKNQSALYTQYAIDLADLRNRTLALEDATNRLTDIKVGPGNSCDSSSGGISGFICSIYDFFTSIGHILLSLFLIFLVAYLIWKCGSVLCRSINSSVDRATAPPPPPPTRYTSVATNEE